MLCDRSHVLTYLQLTTSITVAQDALLNMLHPLAESALKNWIQQNLNYQEYVEFLPIGQPYAERDTALEQVHKVGDRLVFVGGKPGTEALQLKHLPVISITEIREDVGANAGQSSDAFADETILTAGTDYWLDFDTTGVSRTGLIYRYGAWPTEPRSIKVTYFAGLSETRLNGDFAGDVRYAAILTVVKAFKQAVAVATSPAGVGAVVGERIGKYGVQYSSGIAELTGGMVISVPIEAQNLLQTSRNYGRLFA